MNIYPPFMSFYMYPLQAVGSKGPRVFKEMQVLAIPLC